MHAEGNGKENQVNVKMKLTERVKNEKKKKKKHWKLTKEIDNSAKFIRDYDFVLCVITRVWGLIILS